MPLHCVAYFSVSSDNRSNFVFCFPFFQVCPTTSPPQPRPPQQGQVPVSQISLQCLQTSCPAVFPQDQQVLVGRMWILMTSLGDLRSWRKRSEQVNETSQDCILYHTLVRFPYDNPDCPCPCQVGTRQLKQLGSCRLCHFVCHLFLVWLKLHHVSQTSQSQNCD